MARTGKIGGVVRLQWAMPIQPIAEELWRMTGGGKIRPTLAMLADAVERRGGIQGIHHLTQQGKTMHANFDITDNGLVLFRTEKNRTWMVWHAVVGNWQKLADGCIQKRHKGLDGKTITDTTRDICEKCRGDPKGMYGGKNLNFTEIMPMKQIATMSMLGFHKTISEDDWEKLGEGGL